MDSFITCSSHEYSAGSSLQIVSNSCKCVRESMHTYWSRPVYEEKQCTEHPMNDDAKQSSINRPTFGKVYLTGVLPTEHRVLTFGLIKPIKLKKYS